MVNAFKVGRVKVVVVVVVVVHSILRALWSELLDYVRYLCGIKCGPIYNVVQLVTNNCD